MERLIEKYYDLRAKNLAHEGGGAGGEVCIADTDAGRFVLKGTKKGDARARMEPRIVEFLARRGIPTPEFLPVKDGGWFFYRGGKQYNLRPYVEGTVYSYGGAPAWLLPEIARMQGRIHAALAGFEPLPVAVGPEVLDYLRSEAPRASYGKTLVLAAKAGDADVIEDVNYRLSRLHECREHAYDYARFTVGNTQGDYKIQNLVFGEGGIAAVIDCTSANALPLCLEVARAYAHAAPAFSLEGLRAYTEEYRRFAPLNDYDLRMMPCFFRDLCLLAGDYYGQYYAAKGVNRAAYLAEARFTTRVLREFENT
jgi:Ser/Thr protein kinase RdoA (MazF antagonist)